MDEIINYLNDYCSIDFWDYISDKVVVIPSESDMCFYGCFPIVVDDKLVSIRVVIPEIKTNKDKLITVHELAHAIDLYDELGLFYEDNREVREGFVKKIEKKYLKTVM